MTGRQSCNKTALKRCTSTEKQWCSLRPSVLGQDRSETQKKSVLVLHAVVLVLQVWCCVVKHGLVTLVVQMILKDIATSRVLFIISVFCAWTSLLSRSTVAFTYLKVKSAKLLCLLPVVLVLLFWSWSRSYYFGLGLGLKNLVLFTSLPLKQETTGLS